MPRTDKDFSSRREQLIKLALEQFIEKGYENTTITDLQKSFGLTKGGMYHYFNSKEEILDTVIEYGLRQGIKELIEELENTPLEKKLILFFFFSATNDFTRNLFKHSENNNFSIVSYRLREKTVKLTVPVLKGIVREYVEAGFYKTKYSDEMAEFSIILAMAITDEERLPQLDIAHRKGRVDALLDLWSRCMAPSAEHIHELQTNLYKLIGFNKKEDQKIK